MMNEYWNKCDECGQFISISSFESGNASRKLITPDSHFSKEEYETLCEKHKEEKMIALFDPIKLEYTPEFEIYFSEIWLPKNGGDKLKALPDEQRRGALGEWNYLLRGCIEDNEKYRDVIIPENVCEQFTGITDIKTHRIKKSREALFPYIKDGDYKNRNWYIQKNIKYIHHWEYMHNDAFLYLWCIYDVSTNYHHMFERFI